MYINLNNKLLVNIYSIAVTQKCLDYNWDEDNEKPAIRIDLVDGGSDTVSFPTVEERDREYASLMETLMLDENLKYSQLHLDQDIFINLDFVNAFAREGQFITCLTGKQSVCLDPEDTDSFWAKLCVATNL